MREFDILRRLMTSIVVWRREKPFISSYPQYVYLIGILSAVLLHAIFLERNPLERYGVTFDWYDPADEAGQYPRITFSDENHDGIDDIVLHTKQGEEIGVFSIVEPYIDGDPAFILIRGTEGRCKTPSRPSFSEYLRVNIF